MTRKEREAKSKRVDEATAEMLFLLDEVTFLAQKVRDQIEEVSEIAG